MSSKDSIGPSFKAGRTIFAALALATAMAWPPAASGQGAASYRGICDASAAIALGADHFAVADDEKNVLHIFRRGAAEEVGHVDIWAFLGTRERNESDLEGAAQIGDRIYWISSHGLNKDGELKEDRFRLFATTLTSGRGTPGLAASGAPYSRLRDDLLKVESLARGHGLAKAATLAPEKGGLNIEGLAATADGKLLAGLRSPLTGERKDQALVVEIANPAALVDGRNQTRAVIGTIFTIDLGGLGVRSLERVGASYVVVAGPADGAKAPFRLYRWSGKQGEKPVQLAADLGTLNPEAVFAVSDAARLQVLSDDGGEPVVGVDCKDAPVARKSFRAIEVTP